MPLDLAAQKIEVGAALRAAIRSNASRLRHEDNRVPHGLVPKTVHARASRLFLLVRGDRIFQMRSKVMLKPVVDWLLVIDALSQSLIGLAERLKSAQDIAIDHLPMFSCKAADA